jgi:hypothetical protein
MLQQNESEKGKNADQKRSRGNCRFGFIGCPHHSEEEEYAGIDVPGSFLPFINILGEVPTCPHKNDKCHDKKGNKCNAHWLGFQLFRRRSALRPLSSFQRHYPDFKLVPSRAVPRARVSRCPEWGAKAAGQACTGMYSGLVPSPGFRCPVRGSRLLKIERTLMKLGTSSGSPGGSPEIDSGEKREPVSRPNKLKLLTIFGGPDRTRTCDLRFRKPSATVDLIRLSASLSQSCRSSRRDDRSLDLFHGLTIFVVVFEQMAVQIERHVDARMSHDRLDPLRSPV